MKDCRFSVRFFQTEVALLIFGLVICNFPLAASNECRTVVTTYSTPRSDAQLPDLLADVSRSPKPELIPELQKKVWQVSKHQRDLVRSALGYLYCRNGQYQLAIDSLAKVSGRLDPYSPHYQGSLLNMSIAYFELGETDYALEKLMQFHKSRGIGKAYFVGPAGRLAKELQNYELARELLERDLTYREQIQKTPNENTLLHLTAVYKVQGDSNALNKLRVKYGEN